MKSFVLIVLICAGFFVKANTTADLILKDTSIQEIDTLTIMIAESNHLYFYDNFLVEDASNFMSTTSKGIESWINHFLNESKQKNHRLVILLKIQKESALNESSRKAIGYIKKQNYKQGDLKEVEKELIRLTERQ